MASGTRIGFKTAQNSFPSQGNRELPVVLDFTNIGTIFDDLSMEQWSSEIETVQSIYIDNSANASSIIITILDTQQIITAQPFTQGVYPVISRGQCRYKAVTTQGQKIQVIWSNSQKSYAVWGPVPGVTVVPPLTNQVENFAPLAIGDNVLFAGAANTTIKLYRSLLVFGAGATVQFFSGPSANNVPLTGPLAMFAGGSITLQPSGIPWMVTHTADNLVLLSSAAANLGGQISVVQS